MADGRLGRLGLVETVENKTSEPPSKMGRLGLSPGAPGKMGRLGLGSKGIIYNTSRYENGQVVPTGEKLIYKDGKVSPYESQKPSNKMDRLGLSETAQPRGITSALKEMVSFTPKSVQDLIIGGGGLIAKGAMPVVDPISRFKPEQVERAEQIAGIVGSPFVAGMGLLAMFAVHGGVGPWLERFAKGEPIWKGVKQEAKEATIGVIDNIAQLLGTKEEAPSLARALLISVQHKDWPEENKKVYADLITAGTYLAMAPGMVRGAFKKSGKLSKEIVNRTGAIPRIAKEKQMRSQWLDTRAKELMVKNPGKYTLPEAKSFVEAVEGGKLGKEQVGIVEKITTKKPAIAETVKKTLEAKKGIVPKPAVPIAKPTPVAPKPAIPVAPPATTTSKKENIISTGVKQFTEASSKEEFDTFLDRLIVENEKLQIGDEIWENGVKQGTVDLISGKGDKKFIVVKSAITPGEIISGKLKTFSMLEGDDIEVKRAAPIPKFKNTEEALAYGKTIQGNTERIQELQTERDRLLEENKPLIKQATTDAEFSEVSKRVTEAQLIREAVESATEKITKPPKTEGGEISAKRRVFHGTKAEFDKFNISGKVSPYKSESIGPHFGTEEQADYVARAKGGAVKEYDIDIKNPIRLVDRNSWSHSGVLSQLFEQGIVTRSEYDGYVYGKEPYDVRDILKAKGYDGIVYANTAEGAGDSFIAFSNDQITLAVSPKAEKASGSPGGAAAAAIGPGGGYGIIEPSEKSSKTRPAKTIAAKVDEDIPPTEKTSYIKEALKILSPASVSDVSQEASQIMRKGLADLAHKDVIAMEALKKAQAAFSWTSKEDGYKFVDNIEHGVPQENSKHQPFANAVRSLLDQRRDAVRKLGKGQLENFYENYFPHIWEDPNSAKNIITRIMGRKKLEGTKSFLKKRTIMTVKEGLEMGLTPVSDNPVDLVLLKLHEMDRYIMAQNIIKDLKAKGLVKFVYARARIPEGYIRINDNAFTVYMPPEITRKEAFDSVLVDQMMDVAKSLDIDTKRFMNIGGKRWGWAQNVGSGIIRTKFAGPESVLAHEIGHVLGYNFDLFNTFRKYKDTYEHTFTRGKKAGQKVSKPTKESIAWRKNIDDQWRKLADARFKNLEASEGYKKYVRKSREKEAVLLEAFIHAPFEFKEIAPDIYDLFTKFLNEHGQLRPLLDIKPSLVLGQAEGKIKIPGFTTLGHYYAPKDAALILNNHLSPGLRNNENKLIGSSYNILRGVGNVLNQVNLSLSGFHALNVSTDMIASTLGLGIRKLTIEGQRLEGIKDIATSPFAPAVSIWNGMRIKRAYTQQMESIPDPKMRATIEALITSGGRDRMDVFYYNQQVKALQKTFKDILKGTGVEKSLGAVKLPFQVFGSVVEILAKPIMEWYVPTGKIGLFSKLAKSELARAEAGEINDEQLTYMLTKVWDSVDNRMGQLIYDNLFWNKVLKDGLMLAIRSVGWNLGSWREYGGAGLDMGTAYGRIKAGDKLLSHKMTYATGAAILYAILGAVITYMLTGERPREIKDYFFPRTGEKNKDGSDERLSLPTYAKDVYAYATRSLKTLRSKRHPLIGLTIDQATNKDFFSVQVSDFDDPIMKQLYNRAEHTVKTARPFSFKNYEKMQAVEDAPLKNAAISIAGIVSAPSYLARTPAQKLMYRIMSDRMPDVTRTKEDFAKSQYRNTIKTRIRKGERIDHEEARKVLGSRSYRLLMKNAKLPPFAESFKRLSFDESLNVYSIASDEEKSQVRGLLIKKHSNIKTRPEQGTIDLYKELIKKEVGK